MIIKITLKIITLVMITIMMIDFACDLFVNYEHSANFDFDHDHAYTFRVGIFPSTMTKMIG